VVVLELRRPGALLDLALGPELTAAVTSLPAYQKAAAGPEFKQVQTLIEFLEFKLGSKWQEGLRRLVAGGLTLAVDATGATALIVDARDGEVLEKVHDVLVGIARGEAEKRGRPEDVAAREYRGVSGWTFGGDEAHAIVGRRLIATNRASALEAMLDRRARPDARSLASLPAYRAAERAAGAASTATVFVNLKRLKENPGVMQGLAGDARNPMAALLVSPVTEALRRSNWLLLELHVRDDGLSLVTKVDGKLDTASGPASFALPGAPGAGALPNISVPRCIGGISLYRDLHAFYAAKDDLFPERTSGLIFFENMMGIFFSGMDLTEEVLAETGPEIRLVVARQEYDPAVGTPQVEYPAFAAVFRLRNPREFGEVMEEAWQKAVGLINFTRGQQAQPGLIIDRPVHGDTKYTVAYFKPPRREKEDPAESEKTRKTEKIEKVDPRYNFRPALARVGDYLILSSTDGLTRDLIDQLKKEAAAGVKPRAGTHSLLELDGGELGAILLANRPNLLRQNMIEKGNTEEQAATQIDLLLTLVNYVGRVALHGGSRDGRPQLELDVKLDLAQ
jgi:hypothetical protein